MTRSKDAENPREGGFASRWSKRKRAARAGVAEPEALPEPQAEAAEAAPDDRPDAEVLAELNLPDPDQMKPGDDFSAFMAKAVPAHLRQRALRRLWLSDPVYANLDGLVDYAEDFTDAATVIPGMKTLYEAGKGFADRLAKDDEEAASEDTPEAGAVAPSEADPDEASRTDSEPVAQAAPELAEDPDFNLEKVKPDSALTPRKRMHFRLAED